MSKPQLVLDVAGVLLTNLSHAWQEISNHAGIPVDSFSELFKREVRESLWKGQMSESEFWEWIKSYCPNLDVVYARNLIDTYLEELPAMEQLATWSQIADIHLLSNHRKEWIYDLLIPYKPYIKTITISSEVGLCKPDLSIYKLVDSQINSHNRSIFYVDDQEKNMGSAQTLGWLTLIADHEGTWINEITRRLQIHMDQR